MLARVPMCGVGRCAVGLALRSAPPSVLRSRSSARWESGTSLMALVRELAAKVRGGDRHSAEELMRLTAAEARKDASALDESASALDESVRAFAGVVDDLLALQRDSEKKDSLAAALATVSLANLAARPLLRPYLAREDVVGALVARLHVGRVDFERAHAAVALANLATEAKTGALLLRSDGVRGLIALLRERPRARTGQEIGEVGQDACAEAAAIALRRMAFVLQEDHEHGALLAAGAVEALAVLSADSDASARARGEAAFALSGLCRRNDAVHALVCADGVTKLVSMLRSASAVGPGLRGDAQCAQAAAMVLAQIALRAEHRPALVAAGAVEPLLCVVLRDAGLGVSEEGRAHAVRALGLLADQPPARTAMLQAGALHEFVRMIKDPDEPLGRTAAAATIGNLAATSCPDTRESLLGAGAVDALEDLVRHGDDVTKLQATRALYWLA
jgi:hypothetical protein